MTAEEIIANKDAIYLCVKAFRRDANALMLELSRKFDFNLNNSGAWPASVYGTNYINKGILSEDWTFFLHGSHCRFDNLKTGQGIEVCYVEKPEFGCLDGFFFYTYMETTEEFKDLANWFMNYTNVYQALEILSEEGTLTKKPRVASGSYIVAL